MSELNPYEKFLEGRPLEEILHATTNKIAFLLAQIGVEKCSEPPAPGKWSAAEIVCHLADCELVFAFRLRQTLAEADHVIQPFDQEKWAAQYGGISAGSALGVFGSLRSWNQMLIGKALPSAADRTVTHPERGTMTFQTIVETMAGHDLNHLGQLERIAASK
ncbi:MAG TPA: DinB family protein [Terracidiphilus sp.]|nr:DinB family protein [Terracidiphilus sp.]